MDFVRTLLFGSWLAMTAGSTHLIQGGAAGSPWPTPRHDAANTGQAMTGGCNGIQRWSVSTGAAILSSPVIDSAGNVIFQSTDGYLYEMTSTGSEKWKFPLGNVPATLSLSPVIVPSSGVIYAVGVGYQSGVGAAQNVLYSVNSDGSQRWRLITEQTTSSPTVDASGTIYVSGHDNNQQKFTLLAVSPNGEPKWQFETGSAAGDAVNSTPAIATDGTIYVTTQNHFIAIHPDGSQEWSLPLATAGSSPALGADGTIYLGSADTNLYALNPDGTTKWRYPIGSQIVSSAAVGANGVVTIGGLDGYLYAFMQGGLLVWRFNTGSPIFSSPVKGADGTNYVTSGSAAGTTNVYAVSLSGIKVWKFSIGTGIAISSPAIGQDGVLYIGSADGNLVSIGTEVSTIPLNSFAVTPHSVLGGSSIVGMVNLAFNVPDGGDIVSLQSSNPSAQIPPFVVIPPGSSMMSIPIATSPVSKATDVTFTAGSGGVAYTAVVTLLPATLSSATLTPATVTPPASSTLTVQFNGLVGPSGASVALKSNNPAALVPASVVANPGDTSVQVPIVTERVSFQTKALITATCAGISQSVVLTINPPNFSSIGLSSVEVVGGSSLSGIVLFSGPAGPGGLSVNLTSSTSAVKVPATVIVLAGSNSATFSVTTSPVTSTTQSLISALSGGVSKSITLTLDPVSLASLSISPSTVEGAAKATGSVILNGPAPTGGLTVKLSSNSKWVTVPAMVIIGSNQTSVNFALKPSAVRTPVIATITATLKSATVSGAVMVNPPTLTGIVISNSSLKGGMNAQVSLNLSSAAPTGGLLINLSSDSPLVKLPSSVLIQGGKTSTVFMVKTSKVTAKTDVHLIASLGSQIQTANLSLTP